MGDISLQSIDPLYAEQKGILNIVSDKKNEILAQKLGVKSATSSLTLKEYPNISPSAEFRDNGDSDSLSPDTSSSIQHTIILSMYILGSVAMILVVLFVFKPNTVMRKSAHHIPKKLMKSPSGMSENEMDPLQRTKFAALFLVPTPSVASLSAGVEVVVRYDKDIYYKGHIVKRNSNENGKSGKNTKLLLDRNLKAIE